MKQNKIEKYIPVIGITGGVGSGKSVVMEMLQKDFGAAVILADLVAHDLMEPGASSYLDIVDTFGKHVLNQDGTINRKILGEIVFQDSQKLKLLNSITHPNVKKEIIRRIAQIRQEGKAKLIALEAALLIEEGYETILDELWYVYVNEEIRIQRLMEGRGYSEEKSRSIMEQQLSEEIFREHCNRVIDNNGETKALYQQLKDIL